MVNILLDGLIILEAPPPPTPKKNKKKKHYIRNFCFINIAANFSKIK